jgi:hypothetical protein
MIKAVEAGRAGETIVQQRSIDLWRATHKSIHPKELMITPAVMTWKWIDGSVHKAEHQ